MKLMKPACEDNHKHCAYWAASKGECVNNSAWMLVNCKKSCKQCGNSCTIICM